MVLHVDSICWPILAVETFAYVPQGAVSCWVIGGAVSLPWLLELVFVFVTLCDGEVDDGPPVLGVPFVYELPVVGMMLALCQKGNLLA